jgi:large repetitive protein
MYRRNHRRLGSSKNWLARRRKLRRPTIESLESRELLTTDTSPFGYLQIALAADQPGTALLQDANMQNAWGIAVAPGGGPLWVADNTTGGMSRFQGAVSGSPFTQVSPDVSAPAGLPTAIAFNQTQAGFNVGSGAASGSALLLIASQNGEIDGWNNNVPGSPAQPAVTLSGAEFTGLAVANNGTNSFLYAADFHNGKIDVFDSNFNATTLSAAAFTDSSLPTGSYAPYNIQLIGSQLYVTYALQDANKETPVPGGGNGVIAVYNLDGSFVKLLVSQHQLNVPYGLAVAPSTFGDFQGDLLVANSGDGHILAYDNTSGAFVGALNNGPGSTSPMTIAGVRGLAFGNNSSAGNVSSLFYSAASGGHGQLGEILNAFDQTMVVVPTTISAEQGQSFSSTPLATFSDRDITLPAGSFTAQIDWGDGTSSTTGTIQANSVGFDILGSHTYPTAGVRQVSVTAVGPGTVHGSATATANIVDTSFSATSTSLTATQTQNFSGSVGNFSDPTGPGTQDTYVANINWGDGSVSAGNVTLTGDHTFGVTGNHVYSQVGSFTATATVAESNGNTNTVIGTIASAATVADPNTLTATASTFDVTQGTPTSATVAVFTDSFLAATADIFHANIDWGDGTSSNGSVTGSNGAFTVTSSHPYVANGVMTVTVAIDDTPGTATATATSVANVADGNTFTAHPMTFVANPGQTFTGTIATFSDTNPLVRGSDFSATIDWGDGSSTTTGSVTAAGGSVTVSGSHSYSSGGVVKSVAVTINENPPSTGTASSSTTSTAVVPRGDVTGTGGTFSATATTAGSPQTLATFSANTGNTADHFTATIDWGDGSSFTEGTVTTAGSGVFTVVGSHTYAAPGNFTPDVIVYESTAGGTATPAAAVLATANIASPVVLAAATLTGTEHVSTSYTVATFTDVDASATQADFAATIDWGDGSTADRVGSVTLGGNGIFTVTGLHAFTDEGPFNVKVTLSQTTPVTFSNSITSQANIAEGDNFTAGTAQLAATKNVTFSGALAFFTDADTVSIADDFSAAITWGDGLDSDGTVTGSNGHFTVSGNHTYSQDGKLPLVVTIQDKNGTAERIATAAAIVTPGADFTASASSITATEGQAFSGAVATFVDPGSTSPAAAFTATINWGDGTSTTTTTSVTGASGNYTVAGSHTYADEGSFQVTVRIVQTATSATLTATGTAAVSDADVLTAAGTTIAATTGVTFTGTVGIFTDTYAGASASDFSATIDWGDGTSAAAADSITGSNGTFTVVGSHTYAQTGSKAVTVTLADHSPGTASATATSTASVSVAATAKISGTVFNDLNVNGQLDSGEPGLGGRTVFLNNDGTGLPGGNPSTTTDANGNFSFSSLPAGNYTVMEVIPTDRGVTLTTPVQAMPITVGQQVSGVNLGNVLTSTILPMPVSTAQPPAVDDANTAYINAVYQSVLGHAPDAAGLAFWQQQLASGADRSVVAQGVWNSDEHRGLEVDQFYQEYLGRAAEPTGRAYWIALFDAWGDEQIDSACFQISPEFLALHQTDTSFVDALYNDVDLRAADAAGEAYWVGQLAGGETRGQVALNFVFGQEASTQVIDGFYANYLHHAPDSASLQNWVNALTQRTSTAGQVAIQILASDEYFSAVTANRASSISSAATTSFAVGTAGSFSITTSGIPIGTIHESGALPSGVTFTDNDDGTATIGGTPAASTGGTYALTLTASNGIGTAATQNFVLTVGEALSITSAATATFTAGTAGSFKISTVGFPKPSITETGALPSGVTLTDNHDGTATLAGTPAAGTGGVYNLNIIASNNTGAPVTQSLVLTVDQAPAITSANAAMFTAGTAGTFAIAAAGTPVAAITLATGSTLPSGVTLVDNGNNRATLSSTTAAAAGTYHFTISASNNIGTAASQPFTLTINAAPIAPAITSATSTAFTEGTAGTFTVTTTGGGTMTLAETGSLPSGVAFHDNGNGTATLAGTPAAGTAQSYAIVITAHNGTGSDATQNFTLTVNAAPTAPAITSATSTAFTEVSSGTFTITTTGGGTMTLAETGSLPSGVTFHDNGNGTATLAGTPAAGMAGSYPLVITAHNGAGSDATQNFTLTVSAAPTAPAITSATSTAFTEGSSGTFTVTTTGGGTMTLAETGALPSGVTFVDNGNGTATLAGTPAAGMAGSYPLVITAHNGAGSDATQNFTLTVNAATAPAFTSADNATFAAGVGGTFTVSASGSPTPTITETDSPPPGVSLSANNVGNATLTVDTSAVPGTYTLNFSANNNVGAPVTQQFHLTIS